MQNKKIKTPDNGATTLVTDSTTNAVSVQDRIEMAAMFLLSLNYSLTKDKSYFTYLWIQHYKDKTDRKTIAFNAQGEHWQAARTAIEYNDKDYNVYFGVHLTDRPFGEHERPDEKDITAQVAIIADLDCKSSWHVDTDKKKYPTIEQAKKFLPFEPSLLIDSGGGLHSYVLLFEPLKFATDDDRHTAKERNQDYISMIREVAKKQGYSGVDGVADLPRILRLPGTYNLKHGRENAPLCKILNYENLGLHKKYFLHNLDTLIKKPAKKTQKSTVAPADTLNFNGSNEYDIARARAMLATFSPAVLTYDEWLHIGMALKTNGNTCADWEEWSRQDPEKFKVGECESKWRDFYRTDLTIATIHDMAKKYGNYNEKDFRREHPELKSVAPSVNEKSDSRKLSREEKFALFSLPHTDLYNAQRLSMFHGKHIRFLTDSARWYTYNGTMWQDSGKENSAILPFCIDLSHTISANIEETIDADEKLAKKWQDRKTFSAAIEILKGVNAIRITEQDLNTHAHLLNCKNGVVDLQTGILYPHDSKLLLTQCVNAVYRAGYTNDRVDKFLREILPDAQTLQALLRFLGYCLTGSVQEEKSLFIHGLGGNGKGTLTRFLLNLFDGYGCGFPIEAVLVQPRITKDADTATPAFNKLQWRRLAISEEIPAGRKLDYAKFKLLTGGDSLPIRKLFSEATEIKNPTHKFIFSGNHLPELDDTHDIGILRRWIQIKFEQDFTGSNCDTTLKQFLQTDDALSALLTLLVDSAIAWHQGGLIISDKMQRDRNSYFAENDFLNDFISSYCVRDNEKSIPLKAFLNKLRDVCSDETRGQTDRALTNMIEKIPFISKRRMTKGNFLFGVGWSDDNPLDFEGENVSSDDLPPM